jgi:hypothetical protein
MLPGWKGLDLYHHRHRVTDYSLEGLFRYPARLAHTRTPPQQQAPLSSAHTEWSLCAYAGFFGLSTCSYITDRSALSISSLCPRLVNLSFFVRRFCLLSGLPSARAPYLPPCF